MSGVLHFVDIWLYQLVSAVWAIYWPIVAIVLCFTLIERRFPVERAQPWQPLRFNLVWQLLSLTTLFVLSSAGWDGFVGWLTKFFPLPLIPLKTGRFSWRGSRASTAGIRQCHHHQH